MERLTHIGSIIKKKSVDIKKSRIGLGFEKLDRDVFNPEDAYDFVAESGVKWARLQSGWQRTEKVKGVYDFAWLDSIVDRMISIGVEPWLCLCYGNELYSPAAKTIFGAVHVMPLHTEEERTAWVNYVTAVTTHFKGRIHYYEVWNEPDAGTTYDPTAVQLAEFTAATAKACKTGDPTCEVLGLVTFEHNDFNEEAARNGILEHLDGVTYHAYYDPINGISDDFWKARYNFYRELCRSHGKPDMKIIQGESGAQSRSDGWGSMYGAAWTKAKQAKYLLRHLITDIGLGVEFTSYFSCVDMAEALSGIVGDSASYRDYGYFGVLGANFNEDGRPIGTYSPKPSFYALQTLTSVLAEDYEVCELPLEGIVMESRRLLDRDLVFNACEHYGFRREDGSCALMYWKAANILSETYEGTISLRIGDELAGKKIKLVDLLNGKVYDLSDTMTAEPGLLTNIPVMDVPLMLMFDDFCDWERIN
ncbi:MAG: hypothetical protein E7463_07955 [Ruminococcaceae bacterium]|nr:hypothetical protein [Oscillospiraceae bacterium]